MVLLRALEADEGIGANAVISSSREEDPSNGDAVDKAPRDRDIDALEPLRDLEPIAPVPVLEEDVEEEVGAVAILSKTKAAVESTGVNDRKDEVGDSDADEEPREIEWKCACADNRALFNSLIC